MSRGEELDEDVQAVVADLDNHLNAIQAELQPLFQRPMKDLVSELPPLEAAKLYVVGAYAINTLFYIYLKTQGVNPTEHPVKDEMERVKAYFKKVQAAAVEQTKKESNTQLNVSAANRFIAAALGGEEGDALKGAAAAGIPDKDSNKKRANSGGEQGGSSEAPKKKKAKTEDGSKKKVKKKKPAA